MVRTVCDVLFLHLAITCIRHYNVYVKEATNLARGSFPDAFVLFDLEYTAWEGSYERNWSDENEHREIIQIGAIQIKGIELHEVNHFLEYVKPVINPHLSDFIVSFTGIAQEDVDTRGIAFSDALGKLGHFIGDLPAYCWGRDTDVLQENCRLTRNAEPDFFACMTNLKPILGPLFESVGIDTRKYTSGTLISAFTKAPEPRRAHDALNDMRNFRDAIRELQKLVA